MKLEDFAARCGWPPRELVVRSRLDALDLLVTCSRCKGTGTYERNPLDSTCYGCAGLKKKLPPLTSRLAASVRKRQDSGELDGHFAAERERRRGAREQAARSQQELLPEILGFVGARKP